VFDAVEDMSGLLQKMNQEGGSDEFPDEDADEGEHKDE
jgi:hypothetical protein